MMKQMMHIAMVVGFLLLLPLGAVAGDGNGEDTGLAFQKFRAAENTDGPGFFWVDTTTGQLWMADVESMAWKYCGAPEGAEPSAIGTYVPRKNQAGAGVFILNAATGQGWWSDGVEWKVLGLPVKTVPSNPEQ